MHILWAGLILGIAAAWGVPIVASLLGKVLPASVQSYLPTQTIPGVSVNSIIIALVYGIVLGAILHLLGMVGVRVMRGRT